MMGEWGRGSGGKGKREGGKERADRTVSDKDMS